MSFAVARGAELRESLDKPVGAPQPPAAEIALLRDAVEAWIKARAEHLDALLALLREPGPQPQADRWKSRVGTFKDDLKRFGSALGSNSSASEWSRQFVSMNTTAEEKFVSAIEQAVTCAQARDYMTVYLETLQQHTKDLETKWNVTRSSHDSYATQEQAAIEQVEGIIADAANKARDLETKIVTTIGDTIVWIKDTLEKMPEGGADAIDIPYNNVLAIAGNATESFRALSSGIETQRYRFETYFREEIGSVLFLFHDFRDDTKEFIDKFGYKEVLEREEDTNEALDYFESAAGTSSGNKTDAEQFADAANVLVKGHVNNAKNSWDDFVSKHEKKFFGPVGPDISKALLDRDVFEKKYERLQAQHLQELAEKWRSNIREVWDVDLSGIPSSLADKYRKTLVEKLRDLDEVLRSPFLDRFGETLKTVLDNAQTMITK